MSFLGFIVLFTSGYRSDPNACANEVSWGMVVINEVMFDPNPPVKASLGEYVELYNRSGRAVSLENWTLTTGSRVHEIAPPGTVMDPGGFCVVCDIILPNDGTLLVLRDGSGRLVHAASYGIPFGGPAWKEEGGWSLESPDPDRVCNTSDLWIWSGDPAGGSPGRTNSCNALIPDREAPVFLFAGFGRKGELNLHFSERIIAGTPWFSQLVIRPGNLVPDSGLSSSPLGNVITCHYPRDPAAIPGFTVTMPSPVDCSGNQGTRMNVRAGSVIPPAPGTVVVNEIMFDPLEGYPWFIELFFPGPGYLDLADLCVGLADTGSTPSTFKPLSPCSRITGPGELVVFTGDLDRFLHVYDFGPSGKWVGLEGMPGMPVRGGSVFIADRSGQTVDMAVYNPEMHIDLIGESKGVSLERIDPGLPGTVPSSWHSAASIEGYGTPGRPNSQSVSGPLQESLLAAEPRVFSPDNDGYNDLLRISAGSGERNILLRLWVTNASGRTVRVLANNHVGAPSTAYSWDGEDENGHMVEEGFYVVHLKIYHPVSGKVRGAKVAVGVRYNK